MAPTDIAAEIRELRLQGNTNKIIQRVCSGRLLEIAPAASQEDDQLWLRIVTAETNLLLLQIDAATDALAPFVSIRHEDRIELHKEALTTLSHRPPFLAGCLLSCLGNLLYRYHAYDTAETYTRRAHSRFIEANNKRAAQSRWVPSSTELALATAENQIWQARIMFRAPWKREEISSLIGSVLRNLLELYNHEAPGRVGLVMAMALDLSALLAWNRGELDSAKSQIYRSLYLLESLPGGDDVRLAHALCAAARIESGHDSSHVPWALHLSRRSFELYEKHQHAFSLRVSILIAQGLVRLNHLNEAQEILANLTQEATSRSSESCLLSAEIGVTKLWILERRPDLDAVQRWSLCYEESLRIVGEKSSIPRRLHAEALLYLGRAQFRLGMSPVTARETLAESIRLAQEDSRSKVEIAGLLGTVETLIDTMPAEALRVFSVAQQRLSTTASAYLREWARRLAPILSGPLLVDVHGKYDEVLQGFTRTYLAYHRVLAGDAVDSILVTSGLSHSRYYRLLRKVSPKGTGRRRKKKV